MQRRPSQKQCFRGAGETKAFVYLFRCKLPPIAGFSLFCEPEDELLVLHAHAARMCAGHALAKPKPASGAGTALGLKAWR